MEPRIVFRSDQIWSALLSRAVSSIPGFPPTLQRKRQIDLLPNHSLLMKGELPTLFLTFAFLINGEKGARCFERHRWAPSRCNLLSRFAPSKNRPADRNAVPAAIHPEEGE
jgi:hypothetical protein